MTPLHAEIAAMIAADGPMPLGRYMHLCLAHPRHGYYATRNPFGTSGDFVTAPDVSQAFGELIGLWAAAVWQAMGRPKRVHLVELGPGRGALMADALRAAKVAPDFHAAIRLHLVENSPRQREAQKAMLEGAGVEPAWSDIHFLLPPGPMIVIANEFFDALPVFQFQRVADGWRERVVGIDGARLRLGLAPGRAHPSRIPPRLRAASPGAVVETRPFARDVVRWFARRKGPTVCLFIDYGHERSGFGDTFQAVSRHAFVDPFEAPGEADLTAHVDFEDLADAAAGATQSRIAPRPVLAQRDLLLRLGLNQRIEALARARPDRRADLEAARDRLIDPAPTGMGALFKALALAPPDLALPAFDA